MRVLVTGGTGFVGGCLLPKLIGQNFEVTCLVRTSEKAAELKDKYDLSTVVGDVTKPETLKGISENIDYVIHLAAMGHVSAVTEESFRQFVGINEQGTKNLLEEFKGSPKLKKFIHFSSTAAMGPIGIPVLDEKSIPNPVTPYQKSKNRSEKIIRDAFIREGFPGLILRPCMIYGPGGYGEFYKFCRLMKKGIFPKVGHGQNLTPLVYVEDVVNAALLSLTGGKPGEVYIIASQKSIPMDSLHKLIMRHMGVKRPYVYIPEGLALAGARMIEKIFPLIGKEPIVTYANIKSTIVDRTFDIRKAETELGYRQKYSFEEGIAATVAWYKEQGKM